MTVEIQVLPRSGCHDECQTPRRAQRIKCEEKTVLLSDPMNRLCQGTTVDESIGGIGLRFVEAPTMRIGESVAVAYNGVRMTAVVRHLTVNEDETFHVGLAWKGAGLSQAARDAVNQRQQSTVTDKDQSPEDAACERFVRMLPGGIYMIWSLYEADRHEDDSYFELGEAVQRLHRHAASVGIRSLFAAVNALQQAIDGRASRESVGDLVNALIAKCMELCETPTAELSGAAAG